MQHKITPANYLGIVAKIDTKTMPKAMQEFHSIITNDIADMKLFQQYFDTDEEVKDCCEFYFQELRKYIDAQGSEDLELYTYTLNLKLRLAAAKLKLNINNK